MNNNLNDDQPKTLRELAAIAHSVLSNEIQRMAKVSSMLGLDAKECMQFKVYAEMIDEARQREILFGRTDDRSLQSTDSLMASFKDDE